MTLKIERLRMLSKNKHFMGEAILFITFVLSLIGMAITDFSPLESHRYWDFMIVFLAIASIGLGWSQELYKETIFQLIVRQLIHWSNFDNRVWCLSFALYRTFKL